jgi:Secretion system C-terminal sorting domain
MKNLLLLTALLVFGIGHAQFIVWETTFDTPEERAGWTFYDGNNNDNTWNIGKYLVRQSSVNIYDEVSPDNVLRHTAYIPNVPSPSFFKPDYVGDIEDWVISPEIDLTGAAGNIALAAMIGRVNTYNVNSPTSNTSRTVFVYVSTPENPVPDVEDFQALRAAISAAWSANPVDPIKLSVTGGDYAAANNALFVQATADLSQYAGQKIYIGLWKNYNQNTASYGVVPFFETNSSLTFQIDEMQIFASELLSVGDIDTPKIGTRIVQNPVTSTLNLQLNPAFEQTATTVKVYNTVGQEVLATAYNDQIEVSALAAGVYIMHVTNDTLIEKLKFIKK